MKRRSTWLRPLLVGIVTGALLATGLAVPAAADTPVTVDEDALASQLFTGIADARFQDGLGLAKAITVSAEFLEWRRLHPAASLDDSKTYLTGQDQLLDTGLTAAEQQLNEPDVILRAIGVLSASSVSVARTASHIRALVEGIVGSSVGRLDSREDLSEGALLNLSWQRSRDDVLSSLWTDVRHSALADPVFAQAWNSVVGAPASLDAAASLDQLKAVDELRGLVDIDKILALADTPDAFLAEAQAQSMQIFEGLIDVTGGAIVDAKTKMDECPLKTPLSKDCTPKPGDDDKDKDKKEPSETDKLKAALTAIDPILKAVDPGFAKDVSVIGGAIVTVANSISKYADDIKKIADVGGKIFSLATVTMTGNVFGAVMSVVGLFGSSDPNKQMQDQVKALQTQVKNLSDTMKTRFDAVDKRLNNIYNTMVAEFDKLSAAIAGNTAQLLSIQQTVAQLGLRLEEVTASILSAIGQDELVDVRSSIDQYIGYADQFGQPIPTFSPAYTGAESDFHLTSTQLDKDTAFLVPAGDADNPALDPTVVLGSNGETRSIDYLAELASKRDPAIASPTAPVGNAAVWNLGAQAYALLALQNPGYARQVVSGRANDVESDGQQILDMAASFAHPVTAPDTSGNYRNALFKSLDSDYRSAVANMSSALKAVRTNDVQMRYEPNTDGVQIKTLKNYDLFWDGTSALSPAPPVPATPDKISNCDVSLAQITSSFALRIGFGNLPAQVKFLNYAYTPRNTEPPAGTKELPDLSICYRPSWVTTRIVNNGTSVIKYGNLKLEVFGRFRLNPTAAWQNAVDTSYTWTGREIAFDTHCLKFNCDNHYDAEIELDKTWPTASTDFQAQAVDVVNSSVLSSATATVRQFLTTRQKLLYDSIGSALTNPATATFAAVKNMNAALRLLQAYAQLGLPIAVQSDELLSAVLFGKFKLIGNIPTDTTIGDAVQTASGNYSSCGTTCTVDALRPIANQAFFRASDAPCAASTAGPGDPLGNCLVEHALRRATDLGARLEVHFKQLFDGDYVEQLPSVARTVDELKVTDRLSHAPAVTAGIGNLNNDRGQAVSLSLASHTTGGKAPYTFTATNLPTGLTLGSGGVIQGTPTTNGTYTVTVTAHDAANVAGNAYTFRWTIGVLDVPDLTGLSWGLARTAISNAGFALGSLTSQTDCTTPEGTVQSQTPAKDTEVATATAPTTPVNVTYAVCPANHRPVMAPLTVSGGNTTITWTDKSTQEDNFVVSRFTSGGQFVSQAADLPSGSKLGSGQVITFTDTTPNPGAPCYKVDAHEFGDSEILGSDIMCSVAAPTVTNPGNRIGKVGFPVSLQITASDIAGETLTYAATGLPDGLTINGGTGLISGSPTRANPDGTALAFNVTVTVTDTSGVTANTEFSWSIAALSGSSVALARNADGHLDLFGTNASDQLFYRSQQTPGSDSWFNWFWFNDGSLLRAVALETNADGRVDIYGVNHNGDVFLRWQTSPGSSYTNVGWTWLGNQNARSIAAVKNADGHLEIFVTTASGDIWHNWQPAPGQSYPANWSQGFGLPGTSFSEVTAALNSNGTVELFATDDHGGVWHRRQITTGGWGDWTQMTTPPLLRIAAAVNANGALTLYGVGVDGKIWASTQTTASATIWTSGTSLGSAPGAGLAQVTARNDSGRIELVAVDTSGSVWTSRQTAANSSTYTPWTAMDGVLRAN